MRRPDFPLAHAGRDVSHREPYATQSPHPSLSLLTLSLLPRAADPSAPQPPSAPPSTPQPPLACDPRVHGVPFGTRSPTSSEGLRCARRRRGGRRRR
ncbi:unnamed protein product [Lampetra planeri]